MAAVDFEFPKDAVARWAAIPQQAKYHVIVGFDRFCTFLKQYVKREKLSGQVLKKRTGRLYRTFVNKNTGELEQTFYAMPYGAAWETGFHRPAYPVFPVNKKALAWKGANGKMWFSKGHVIPAQTFPAKPWFRPSVAETRPQLRTMAVLPLMNVLLGKPAGNEGLAMYGRRG